MQPVFRRGTLLGMCLRRLRGHEGGIGPPLAGPYCRLRTRCSILFGRARPCRAATNSSTASCIPSLVADSGFAICYEDHWWQSVTRRSLFSNLPAVMFQRSIENRPPNLHLHFNFHLHFWESTGLAPAKSERLIVAPQRMAYRPIASQILLQIAMRNSLRR
jgi:hypothetical protein